MNPQNYKVQVKLRHPLLWRKPMLYDQPAQKLENCHSQLNSFAATGQNWRYRNNTTQSHSKMKCKSRITKSKTESSLNQLFVQNKPQQPLRQSMIKSLKIQSPALEKMTKLVEVMKQLKSLNLIQFKALQKITYSSRKIDFIPNDYHSRVANPGFGRSHQGRFYTK